MNSHSDNEPICQFCGKSLTRNDATGSYECLACTFQSMDGGQILDVPEPQKEDPFYSQSDLQKEYAEMLKIEAFQKKLKKLSPNLIVTKILIALNVLAYIYVSLEGGSFNNPSSELLLSMGANNGEMIFAGEWWRIITSMFLHGGLMHIAFNMYALWIIGNIVEKLFGGFGYLVIYICSGILGNMLSLYNHSPMSVGVGASGAVFGIFGALISYAYFKKMPKPIASSVLQNAGLMILVNGAIGLSIPQIDNSAHFGGCIGGIITAYFIGQDITLLNKLKRGVMSLVVSLACIGGVYFSWDFIGEKNSTNKDSRIEKLKEEQKNIDTAIERFNSLEIEKEESVQLLLAEFSRKIISQEVALQVLDKDYIQLFRKEGDLLQKALEKDFVKPEWKKYTAQYMEMYNDFWILYKKAIEESEPKYIEQAAELKKKINAMRPADFK